jgi:uncharacterized protein YabE (DUF348 family)
MSDADVLYMQEAMQQDIKPQFIMTMKEEVEGQTINCNWVLVEQDQLPIVSTRVRPCVWAMRRKHQIQVEGKTECGWRQANTQDRLLGDIRTRGYMDNDATHTHHGC